MIIQSVIYNVYERHAFCFAIVSTRIPFGWTESISFAIFFLYTLISVSTYSINYCGREILTNTEVNEALLRTAKMSYLVFHMCLTVAKCFPLRINKSTLEQALWMNTHTQMKTYLNRCTQFYEGTATMPASEINVLCILTHKMKHTNLNYSKNSAIREVAAAQQ